MAHSSKPQHAPAPPTLTFPLVKAQAMVQERIDEGQKLLAIQPRPGDEFKELKKRAWSWFNYNVALLARIVDSQELKDEFDNAGLVYALSADYQPLANHHEHLERCVAKLESILERLPLYERSAPAESTVARPIQGNSVFLVHGHITAIKAEVARTIERLRLPLTILHEQPDKGRTIIEKFEEHAAAVDFAVVLLTGDDRGAGPDSPDSLSPRARQNVIFELGFFYGKLGRKRVCALYEVGVEIPSELSGILFIPLDVGGAWRVSLAREMKSAGLDIDMNLAM